MKKNKKTSKLGTTPDLYNELGTKKYKKTTRKRKNVKKIKMAKVKFDDFRGLVNFYKKMDDATLQHHHKLLTEALHDAAIFKLADQIQADCEKPLPKNLKMIGLSEQLPNNFPEGWQTNEEITIPDEETDGMSHSMDASRYSLGPDTINSSVKESIFRFKQADPPPIGNVAGIGEKAPEVRGTNPKDLLGSTKVPFSVIPFSSLVYCAMAMEDGSFKYHRFNWRANKVIASIYVDAMFRHMALWYDSREENAEDSGVPHLGHAMACIAILIDALETGNLDDDRPMPGATAKLLEKWNAKLKEKVAKRKLEAKAKEDAKKKPK